jgi:fructosamine-3-kinase
VTVAAPHPLWRPPVLRAVEREASAHLGRPWNARGFTDLDERASHPCGILHGEPFSVFAKLGTGPDAAAQVAAELRGLTLLRGLGLTAPVPVGTGAAEVAGLLLTEALPETPAGSRTADDWRAIGATLATLHDVAGGQFGLDFDGYFGPLRQDNRPVPDGLGWAGFYGQRRLAPLLRTAVDSGHLPPEVAAGVERVISRLPDLCGPDPRPALLHGDAQQNNFVSTPAGAVPIDVAPYFGHPEVDLALVDYFEPVPATLFDAYRERRAIDPGFAERRELWRLHGYLAVVAVDGAGTFGRRYLGRLAAAVAWLR